MKDIPKTRLLTCCKMIAQPLDMLQKNLEHLAGGPVKVSIEVEYLGDHRMDTRQFVEAVEIMRKEGLDVKI